MSTLRLQHEAGKAVTLFAGEQLLCRYVYVSGEAHKESPKPYFHPLNSLAGDTLTNFRPNDHPWHHGLSFTLTNVSGWNFWGGPTCRPTLVSEKRKKKERGGGGGAGGARVLWPHARTGAAPV